MMFATIALVISLGIFSSSHGDDTKTKDMDISTCGDTLMAEYQKICKGADGKEKLPKIKKGLLQVPGKCSKV